MKSRHHISALIILAWIWLSSGHISPLYAQMIAVVNSTADDADSHPWDDPLTDEDETMDGKCQDKSGRCTLRAALEEASIMGLPAQVTFSVSGTIDAQAAFAPPSDSYIAGENQKITIRGKGPDEYSVLMVLDSLTWVQGLVFRDAWDGIIVAGRKNVIGGEHNLYSNVFLGMKQSGINVAGDSNVVLGNYIGIDTGGNVDGNYWGVFITGANNKVGHSDPTLSNTISGNIQGINITGDIAGLGRNNRIVGNFIGTDPSGTQKRGNAVGVQITDAIGTQVGDYIDVPPNTSRNVISGNTESGILVGIMTSDINISTSAYIENNIIGLDVDKQNNLGNRDGIVLGPGSRKVEVRYNTITGNDSNGIVITGFSDNEFDFSSSGHKIAHNEITGNGALFSGATTGNGIAIYGNAHDNIIGDELQDVFNNDGNLIVANHGSGVRIAKAQGVEPHSNTIRENMFSAHRFKGINIVDAQDGIQPPVLASASMGPSMGEVTGTHGRVGARIDIYKAGSSGYSSYFEGEEYLAGGFVQGDGTFSFDIPPCNCSRIIATATDPAENTSEFSDPLDLTALPIQLAASTAAVTHGNDVEISWRTVSETNNYGFEIQRKRGDQGNWGKIAFQEGHGTTLTPQSYSYVDRSVAFGKYFYRIKQLDLDGKSEAFAPMEVSVGVVPDKLVLAQNYPNPFNPTTVIEFVVAKSGRTTLKVFNLLGQEVATLFDANAEAGEIYATRLEATKLGGGSYFYRLQSAGKVETKRMLLVK